MKSYSNSCFKFFTSEVHVNTKTSPSSEANFIAPAEEDAWGVVKEQFPGSVALPWWVFSSSVDPLSPFLDRELMLSALPNLFLRRWANSLGFDMTVLQKKRKNKNEQKNKDKTWLFLLKCVVTNWETWKTFRWNNYCIEKLRGYLKWPLIRLTKISRK